MANSIPVSTLENNPLANEYKLMVKVISKQAEEVDYIYIFVKVFPQSWAETGIYPNELERTKLQLIFNKNTYPTWKDLKEQLRPNRVLIIFGKLSEAVNDTGGRSFTVYRLALMPENIMEIKDQSDRKQPAIKIKVD